MPASAQKQKSKGTKVESKDTLIIFEKAGEEDDKNHVVSPLFEKKVTIIKVSDTGSKSKKRPTYKDTVIVIRKGLTKDQLKAKEEARIRDIMKKNNFCECVKMDVEAPNVLKQETYLNYELIFKNNCKVDVWVSTRHFRYRPVTSSGKPVKVLRKLSFVQKFGQPDFVKIAPGEGYTFKMSDDVFFEFDLKKGQAYRFYFEHRNLGERSKQAPEKTYLCNQQKNKLIVIQ